MKVSALLPTRNAAETLPKALRSLREQTHPLEECVVVDDGSTDSTPSLLAELARDWPALRVERTPGVGISAALNLGLSRCSSPWIARMDADDVCAPERIARQLELAATDSALALIGCRVSSEGALEGMRRHVEWANSKMTHEELELALWVDSPLPHPSWLVHRRAFELVGNYDESGALPEDYDWLHRFFAAARARPDLRAAKPRGNALVEWADLPDRLTRKNPAYSEEAFNRVKTRMLRERVAAYPRDLEVFIFGLGPKAKALFPLLGLPIRAIVDVHPRRTGMRYQGTEVWDVARWSARARETDARPMLVLNCVGTPEARESCENLGVAHGLTAGAGFLSL